MEYLYDGSFNGLLTCIYQHYYYKPASAIYQQVCHQPTLMTDTTVVVTDPVLAARVYEAIQIKNGEESLDRIYHAYLSSAADKENLILKYICSGFRLGPKINLYHTHPDVYPLHKIDRQVTLEVHRFLGLLRFADTGRFLYSLISPDHNILPLIADHFVSRLANERWIIHDQRRKLAVIYDGQDSNMENSTLQRQWYLTDFSRHLKQSLPEKELYYQQLWQLYFNEIGIENRYNPRLQSQFVPLRYRRHLTEFQVPRF